LQRLRIFEKLDAELDQIGMKADDRAKLVEELREATKHAAEGLQVLRRAMGDVHGTKAALRKMAYDAIKWSSAICALFEGEI
jgi:hypothetical protein